LCFLCALPKNPSAHIGRALDEFNALIFAGNDRVQSERSPCNGATIQEVMRSDGHVRNSR